MRRKSDDRVATAARILVALAVLGTVVMGATGMVAAHNQGEYGGGETDDTDEFADLTGLELSDSVESEHVSYGTSGASPLLR
jgi:hypothetical protein